MITLGGLLARTESGSGDPYKTVFGHSQREGGQYAGLNITAMPLRDVLAMQQARGHGSYGEWVKAQLAASGQEPRIATPLGRGQVVGTTLGNVAQTLGLDMDSPFDKTMQDRVISHLATQRLGRANTPAEKRAQLRAEWEGFKHVGNDELDEAILNFENDPSTLGVTGVDASADAPAHQAMMGFQQRKTDTPLASFSQILEKEYHERGLATYNILSENARIEGAQMQLMFPEAAAIVDAKEAEADGTVKPSFNAHNTGGTDNAAFNIGVGGPTGGGSVSTNNPQEAARKLFNPTAQNVGELLSGLGVGFGQMSAGQPVNMMPTVMGLRKQRATAAQQELDQQNQAIESKRADMRLDYERRRVENTERRLRWDQAKADKAAAGDTTSPFTPETRAEMTALNPNLKPMFDRHDQLIANGQIEEAVSLGNQLYQAGTAAGSAAETLVTPEEARAFLEMDDAGQAEVLASMGDDKRGALKDALGVLKSNPAGALTNEAKRINEEVARNLGTGKYSEDPQQAQIEAAEYVRGLEAAGLDARLDSSLKKIEYAQDLRNEGKTLQTALGNLDDMLAGAGNAANMSMIIEDGTASTINIANKGGDTSPITGALATGYEIFDTLGLDGITNRLEELTGIPQPDISQLNADGAAFMFAVGSSIGMLNQGFSDADRQALMSSIPSAANTTEGRMKFLTRYGSEVAYKQAASNAAAEVQDRSNLHEVQNALNFSNTTLVAARPHIQKYLEANNWAQVTGNPADPANTAGGTGAPIRTARGEVFSVMSKPYAERAAFVQEKYGTPEEYGKFLAQTGYPVLTQEMFNAYRKVIPGLKALDANDPYKIMGMK